MNDGKKMVLVVEDNPRQAEKIANILNTSYSYYAVIAANGVEALAVIKKNRRFFGLLPNRIKCVLLDLQMPEMSGEEFLKIFRQQERKNIFAQFLPIIVITAYNDLERWDKVTDPIHGMVAGYLNKPIDEQKLLYLLHSVIFKEETEYFIEETLRKDIELHEKLDNTPQPGA
ncbi:MAG: response regulator [Candidatus Margulisiibacteriota bacterium]|jgi:CheY-like chemotaxis protein